MLHYQISPPAKPPAKPNVKEEELNRPAYLVLGAFATVPKIHFETVKLGQSKKKTLIIRNPGDQVAWLKTCKKPSAAFELSFNGEPLIQSKGQFVLDITWTPTEEGQFFEPFQFQSSLNGIRFSVHLLGICIAPAKRNSSFRRRALVSTENVKKCVPTKSKAIENPNPGSRSGITITIPKSPFTRENINPNSPTKSLKHFTSGSSALSFNNIMVNNTSGDDKKDNTEETLLKTPTKTNQLASDMLDAIAFPFTPDSSVEKSNDPVAGTSGCGVNSVLRRETFLIEEDSQFFQGQTASPDRRETYLVTSNMGTIDSIQGLHDFKFHAPMPHQLEKHNLVEPNTSEDDTFQYVKDSVTDGLARLELKIGTTTNLDSGINITSLESSSKRNEEDYEDNFSSDSYNILSMPVPVPNSYQAKELELCDTVPLEQPSNYDEELKNLDLELHAFLLNYDNLVNKARKTLSKLGKSY